MKEACHTEREQAPYRIETCNVGSLCHYAHLLSTSLTPVSMMDRHRLTSLWVSV